MRIPFDKVVTSDGEPSPERGIAFPDASPAQCLAAGKLIYDVATNPAEFKKFQEHPEAYLSGIGVSTGFLEGRIIKVVEDTQRTVHIVVPSVVDETKKDQDLKQYLMELGFVTIMGCK
jgi:hypothetical protein